MAKVIGLPKLSPTMEEGTLLEWSKSEGDAVEVDDLLAEVETDKATMEFRSFDKGVLLKILVEAGESVAPDTPVAIIGEEGEDISELLKSTGGSGGKADEKKSKSDEKKSAKADKKKSKDTQKKSKDDEESDEEEDTKEKKAKPKKASEAKPKKAKSGSGERMFASPLVRRLARENDVDLADVDGSGPRGRVIKRDLDAYLESGGSQQSSGGFERRPPRIEKASPTRKTIARRLTESKQTVPHFYLTIDLDAGALVTARRQMNASIAARAEKSGETLEKISFNDLVIKASALALREIPEANASWMEDGIHYHQVVDVSVAVAIPEGLVTPVVRDADRKGVLAISREVKDFAARARDRKLKPEEMSNGTFSISNLGMYGVEEFAAVINPPEGALLAVGALRDAAIVRDGVLVAGKKMKVTLSCDHRVIDGAVGARFLQALQGLLEAPLAMLL